MTFINIVSALGNNSSIYPLLFRDCGIENSAKVYMTYKQNVQDSKFIAKQATRERILDEYGTSTIWLFGIPCIEKIYDKLIKKKGFFPFTNSKLFNETSAQGINLNIDKFKNLAKEEVQDLVKIRDNKKVYQFLQIKKFLAATIIPIALMGFVLPKLNFSYTAKKLRQNKETPQNQNFNTSKVSFKGLEKLADLSTLQKMIILDGGLTVGRVKTARNKEEKSEMAFKMAGMIYLNYFAPKRIEKGLNALTGKLFGIETALDPKILNDNKFVNAIKNKTLTLPEKGSGKALIDFIDKNPDAIFTQIAQKSKIVSFLKNKIRDPRLYVDTEKLVQLKNSIEDFSKSALNSGNVETFAKKALRAKCFNIFANIGISSALLAVALPKAQFMFRKMLTGSNLEPGIK